MSDVQRYALKRECDVESWRCIPTLTPHEHGDYVKHSDYAALESRLTWLTADQVPEWSGDPQLWIGRRGADFCGPWEYESRERLLANFKTGKWLFFRVPEWGTK